MMPWDSFGNMPNGEDDRPEQKLLPRYREYEYEEGDLWEPSLFDLDLAAQIAGQEYQDCCPGDDDDDKKKKKERPDADGHLTLAEANDWYRNGKGQPLYVDLGKIDLSDVYESDIPKKGGDVNLFLIQSPLSGIMGKGGGGNVYGSIKLKLIGKRAVVTPIGYFDYYNFNQQKWGINPFRWLRNIGTYVGKQFAGEGTPYKIYFYGIGTLGEKTPLK